MTGFEPLREAGLAALKRFVPHAGHDYAERRNFDFGPERRDNISMLSPYIRHRLVSEEEAVRAVLSVHSLKTAEKFVQEIFWRSYWKGWLEQRPSVWDSYQQQLRMLDEQYFANMDGALAGETGIDCFDFWVRELIDTGYLHNHVRMWFASIWIFTLRLPWQKGAALFMQNLFDGDPASNTLSWRWVAGLQTAGKHYVADADNIRRYTDGRFAPSGLSLAPEPLSAWPHPEPTPIAVLPQVPPKPFILLITEEDLTPVLPDNCKGLISAVMLCPLAQMADPVVNDFRQTALHSATQAIATEIDVPLLTPSGWSLADWADVLSDYPEQDLVTAYPPVGPLHSALGSITAELTNSGRGLHYFRRHWDDMCWPLARKGFFPFKENIPAILNQLAIA